MSIIHFDAKYLKECAQLYVKVFNSEPWNDKWDVESAYKRLNDICNTPNFEGIVYIEDDKVKGAILGNYEYFYNGNHYNLKEMFIANEMQGKGIGSSLISHLEQNVKRNGAAYVNLFTLRDSITEMFYKKNGYSELSFMAMMGKKL